MPAYMKPVPGCCCCCAQPNLLTRIIDQYYAPLLLKPAVKAVVLVAFLALAIVSVFGAINIKQEFRQEWFLPGDSYLQDFYAVRNDYYTDVGVPVAAYVGNVNPAEKRAALLALGPALTSNKWVDDNVPAQDWVKSFKDYLTAASLDYDNVAAATFQTQLVSFLANPAYARFKSDVVWKDGNSGSGVVEMARVKAFYIGMDKAENEVDAMNSVESDIASWAKQYSIGTAASDMPGSFAYAPTYGNWALFEVVEREAFTNIGLALAAVFVVVLVFLANLGIAITVVVHVALVLLAVLGIMVYWDVSLDSVSLVNLVLAIGLSVDYSCHVAHAFMHKQGTRDERAHLALKEMGVSVINGAVSTFLAVLLLGGSKSYIFVVFFKMFFLSCTMGAAHGLVLLPVVLSLVGPAPHEAYVPVPRGAHDENGTASAAAGKGAQPHEKVQRDHGARTSVELAPV